MFPPKAFICNVMPKYSRISENQMMDMVKVRLRYIELNSVITETFSLALSGACSWSWKLSARVILFRVAIRCIIWPSSSIRPRANSQRGDSGKLNLDWRKVIGLGGRVTVVDKRICNSPIIYSGTYQSRRRKQQGILPQSWILRQSWAAYEMPDMIM